MIKKTSNYDLFTNLRGNREVDLDHPKTRRLAESMVDKGWLKACPLIAKQGRGKRLTVLDGQHRLSIAESFDIPVYYTVVDYDLCPAEFNDTSKAWSVRDYVQSYASTGNEDYQKLIWFSDKYAISLTVSAAILYGNIHGGGMSQRLREGTWKIKDLSAAIEFADYYTKVADFHKALRKIATVTVLWALWHVEYFDRQRLLDGVDRTSHTIKSLSNRQQVMDFFEDAYNYRSRDKRPISFDASAAMQAKKVENLRKTA